MCSMAVVTRWRPRARAARPRMARLFASVALAVKMTPAAVAPTSRATLARAVEGDARPAPPRVRGPRVAHAALEERAHQRDATGVARREARAVEVDTGDARAHPTP